MSLDETKLVVWQTVLQTNVLWHQLPSMSADDTYGHALHAYVFVLLAVPELH